MDYTPDDILAYALSGNNLNDISIITAADKYSLPYLYYGSNILPDGMVYYVESLGIIAVSSGNTWLALDGTVLRTDAQYNNAVWAWGCNSVGQFGDNCTESRSSPVSTIGGFTDWGQVSAGCQHTLGLRNNGVLYAWGSGEAGRLGNNCTTSRSSPVSVVGGFTDWCNISAGHRFSVGIRQNGTAWGWGYNYQGALGDNTNANKSSPVSVVGGFTDWCQISGNRTGTSNRNTTLAVRQNGTAWGWGLNDRGQLGDGTTTSRRSPVSVTGGIFNWCQVSAGAQHSLGLIQTGVLYAWGYGSSGRLGNNNTVSCLSPVTVVGGFTDWCNISAGYDHSAAVRTNGTLWTWGASGSGQLGNNCSPYGTNRSSPVSVVGGFTNWGQVSAGCRYNIAVQQGGTAWAWGNNDYGQLGTNNNTSRSSPVSVVGINNWFQVTTGGRLSVGITFD